jgi:putative transcriptional regulator
MQEQLRTGQLLAATPMLGDVNFRRTIVLIVEDEPTEGTLGVVLNRPSKIPVDQVLGSWTPLVTGPSVLFHGGPVSPDSALALALPRGADEPIGWRSLSGSKLMSRVGLVDLGAPPEILAGELTSMRVFAGYAGWGAGQLETEIEAGAWLVLDAVPEDAFATDPDRLYPSVLRRQGGEVALLSTYPDDPVLN